jgi:hypothetical protein
MAATSEKTPTAGDYTTTPAPALHNAALSSGSDTSLDAEASGINEKALLRKLDWKLLPAVSLLYLLSFLDRSNGLFLRNTFVPSLRC